MIFNPDSSLLTFWQHIQPLDKWLITHINQNWGNVVFDTVLPYFRETLFWIPLYLFLMLFVILNFKVKGVWWIIGVALAAALSDIISSQIIKQHIMRVRPCQDADVAGQLRFFINYCPQSSSFTSSHATTYFAQGVFMFSTLRSVIGRWSWLFIVWAATIAYTQVYVGVHYPFDVFCGALLGSGIGFAITKMFHKQIGLLTVS